MLKTTGTSLASVFGTDSKEVIDGGVDVGDGSNDGSSILKRKTIKSKSWNSVKNFVNSGNSKTTEYIIINLIEWERH